jgi:hypothetical protein
MLSGSFTPEHVDVLAGDGVTWTNDSVRRHTVSAADGAWTSGSVSVTRSYTRAFTAAGTHEYLCTLHPGMRGEVAVHSVLLDAPREAGAPGRAFVLTGRSAMDGEVTIEGDDGSGFRAVGRATAAGGSFRAPVAPVATMRYRAVAGGGASPAVQLLVLDREVSATARRHGRVSMVRVRVTPASPRATVVLQAYLPERFGWWPIRRARLDRASRATFHVATRRRLRARAVLTLSDGATSLARSPVLRIGPRR